MGHFLRLSSTVFDVPPPYCFFTVVGVIRPRHFSVCSVSAVCTFLDLFPLLLFAGWTGFTHRLFFKLTVFFVADPFSLVL